MRDFLSVVRRERFRQERVSARLDLLRFAIAAILTTSFVRELDARALAFAPQRWSALNLQLLTSTFVAAPANSDGVAPPRLLADYHGKPVLVAYWSLECAACANLLRDLGVVHDRFRSRGLQILAINVDDSTHDAELAREHEYRAYAFDEARDTPGHGRLIRGTRSLPLAVLFSDSGVALRTTIGLMPDRPYSAWVTPAMSRELSAALAR